MAKKIDIEWIIKRIAVRADEFVNAAGNSGGTPIEAPIESIEDEIEFSRIFVLRYAKEELLHSMIQGNLKHHQGDYVDDLATRIEIDDDDLSVIVVCPSDFLRFVAIKMTDWKREVRDVFNPRDPIYQRHANNPHTGGNYVKPVAFLTSSFKERLSVTGTVSTAFTVGNQVSIQTDTAGASAVTGVVSKIVNSGTGADKTIEFKELSGGVPNRGTLTITETGSGTGAMNTITDVQDELNKYRVMKVVGTNFSVSTLANGVVVDGFTAATGDIIVFNAQTNQEEEGTYRVGATPSATLKLSDEVKSSPKRQAIECFRSASVNAKLDLFHYIPDVPAENFSMEVLDMLIDYTASRVLKYIGDTEAAALAQNSAFELMGVQKQGLKGEM